MKILVLGGIAEGQLLAARLAERRCDVEYSLAGRTRHPALPPGCRVRSGGFGAVEGLRHHLECEGVQLLIDATHPYAAQISRNAHAAAAAAGIPLWALRRPPWRRPAAAEQQRSYRGWAQLHAALRDFRRPFLTIPAEALGNLPRFPPWPRQLWTLRVLENSVRSTRLPANIRIVHGWPAAEATREEQLLRRVGADVLVCRNSGGQQARGKILAARRLGLPVLMLHRPPLPRAERQFCTVEALLNAFLASFAGNHPP